MASRVHPALIFTWCPILSPLPCTNTSARHDPAGYTQPSPTPPEHFRCSDVRGSVHESVHESVHVSVHRLILGWFNVLSLNGMNGTDGDGI